MKTPAEDRKFLELVAKLHALLGSANLSERDNAMRKLNALLEQRRKTWNDLPELLQLGIAIRDEKNKTTGSQKNEGDDEATDDRIPVSNIFDLIFYTLKHYLYFRTEHELVAVSLWTLHTFVFDKFMITPRLAFLSPVRGCGKTTLLTILSRLTCRPERHDDLSVAALYQSIDFAHPTLLLDEGDNFPLAKPGPMRTIFNVGHHQDGSVTRSISGQPRRFSVFSPMAIAAIGSLPLPLLQRAIVINMERAPRGARLRRLDTKNPDQMQDFDTIHWHIYKWARQCVLALDPPMPRELHNRPADNWRILFAIADACDRGELARDAAVALSRQHQDEDVAVELLADIRRIYDARHVDRITSADLTAALHDELEDAQWAEWCGRSGGQQPHRLSQAELAATLRPFGIVSKSVWPIGPRAGLTKSRKGYYKSQFEAAWRAYVDLIDPDEDAADQPRKTAPLRLV